MSLLQNLLLVFIAGLITDLATGLGAIPFFFQKKIESYWLVIMWGLASGIMLSASIFGLMPEAISTGTWFEILFGLALGVALVILGKKALERYELEPGVFEEATFKKMILILGVLTVHSFPEGVAIGVSFAELGFDSGIPFYGFMIPPLAIIMTISISIHNIPEGVAISIPLKAMGMNKWKMLGATIFSSLPQPIGAVVAFLFVRQVKQFVPVGFAFAAGAMIYLVLTEFVEEAAEEGEDLDDWRIPFAVGTVVGFIIMIALGFSLDYGF
ncbi:MAG: ZIP family metal transporter [Candidatus Magasanikbacteria bacterium]